MARAQKPDRFELPVVGPAYQSRELELSAQVTKNLFPEINQEARSMVALHNTAGLNIFATLEDKDRGMHDFHGFMHSVNGTSLWSVDADGVNLNLGTIGGAARCVMADDGYQLVIVSDGLAYIYTEDDGLQLITDPDLVEPTSVAYLNSIFIFDQNRGTFGEWVSSELLTSGFNVAELDFAQAEGHPDDIVRVFSFKQLVYFFGSKSIEPWYLSGNGNPPFDPIQGGVAPYGLAGIHAVVSTSEYMYFLDDKRIPRRSSGLDFQSIGNPALGVEFSKYGTINDVIAYTFIQDHQVFFALTFPTEDRTWCFHEPSGSWFQLSYGVNDARHRASSMLDIYGLNYCADHSNGLIYHYDPCTYTDNGEPIQRRRDTALIHGGLFQQPGRRMFIEEVEFIVGAGACQVKGTGMGPQPIIPVSGICGTASDLTVGQLLNVSPLSLVGQLGAVIIETDALGNGCVIENSNIICFTCALCRENPPQAGTKVGAFELLGPTSTPNFAFYMDSNGYMNIYGRNAVETEILEVQITNAGSSFADSTIHMFAVVIDLSDPENREIYVDATNVGKSSVYVTWITYSDDILQLADEGSGSGQDMTYYFGLGYNNTWGAPSVAAGSGGPSDGIDCLGYISFDNTCSLIPASVWDSSGFVRDPGAWEGWYLERPAVFYGPSFWRNSGTTAPLYYEQNNLEKGWEVLLGEDYYDYGSYGDEANLIPAAVLNVGIAGLTQATGEIGSLPDAPPPDPQSEIVQPFYANTGNWIDISLLDQTTFEDQFGYPVEQVGFSGTYDLLDKSAIAILVNATASTYRIQLDDVTQWTNGSMHITDASGNVVSSMLYTGVPTGQSLTIPAGSNHYIVIDTDTTSFAVNTWNTAVVDITGSVPWTDYFTPALDFNRDGLTVYRWTSPGVIIPAAGVAIRFTAPSSGSFSMSFNNIEVPFVHGSRTGSVNQGVLNFTTAPVLTKTPANPGDRILVGMNRPGLDLELVPGQTYFYNIRNDNPTAINNSYNECSVTVY